MRVRASRGWVLDGGSPARSARAHTLLVPFPPLPDTPAARRLLATAAEVARRLGRVCADWPDDRFGALVYDATFMRLRAEVLPDDAAALRREYAARRDAYAAALRPVRVGAADGRTGR